MVRVITYVNKMISLGEKNVEVSKDMQTFIQ